MVGGGERAAWWNGLHGDLQVLSLLSLLYRETGERREVPGPGRTHHSQPHVSVLLSIYSESGHRAYLASVCIVCTG